jgi:UDP-N-acetylglucosamine 2-epimerase (non-hydrolysing)
MKILSVFGTRPEAIKMAVLCKQLNQAKGIEHKVCITAQHRSMLDQVMDFFEIEADYDLNIMQTGQDLTDVTAKVLVGLRNLFANEYKPDLVLVHGDTTTCFTTTLAAFYAGIKVGHIEAGLRTYNMQSPFPEEANRVLVGRLAYWHFAPTARNVDNLIKEGVKAEYIIETGNTVLDSLLFTKDKVAHFSSEVKNRSVHELFASDSKILLVTGHRRENFGSGFLQICKALKELASKFPDLEIVYPVHLNPNVQNVVFEILKDISNVHLIEPLIYPDFVYAMNKSWAILTDSGGVQEEAPSLGKPVLVMRDTTERPEALKAGTVQLVGANRANIVEGVSKLYNSLDLYIEMSQAHNPYGDGKAVDRIVDFLLKNALK